MHTAPLGGTAPVKHNSGNTLLEWYSAAFPPVMEINGRKKGEGGLVHRLDFETQGLVLFAKNQRALDTILAQQDEGTFTKEYSAICQKAVPQDSTFPQSPVPSPQSPILHSPLIIESYFRPFGPGRKLVRPVTDANGKGKKLAKDKGGYYRTEVDRVNKDNGEYWEFTIRLKRGFRHQIRCHLAWIGCPVLNDPLYGTGEADNVLALRAYGLSFFDPQTGRKCEFRISPLPFNDLEIQPISM
jgi:23S rRNA pseudouridine1911/1915/1917 synthase